MTNTKPNIFSFKVKNIIGEDVPLSTFKGKVLLIVNTASSCGFTPQLKDLQELQDFFGAENFSVLGFPTNDFGKQEPLNGTDISNFCEKNYGVKFPVFEKMIIRGDFANSLYKFLSNKKLNGVLNSTPRWNFHKYLINQNGEVVDYFLPITNPTSSRVKKRIQRLLDNKTI